MFSSRLHFAKIVVATGLCLTASSPMFAADLTRGPQAYAVTPLVSPHRQRPSSRAIRSSWD